MLHVLAGGIGVSVIVVSEVFSRGDVLSTWALLASWISWCAAVTAHLLSHQTSHRCYRLQVEDIDRVLAEPVATRREPKYENWALSATKILNAIVWMLFVCGMAAFLVFSWDNIEHRRQSRGDKATEQSASNSIDPTEGETVRHVERSAPEGHLRPAEDASKAADEAVAESRATLMGGEGNGHVEEVAHQTPGGKEVHGQEGGQKGPER